MTDPIVALAFLVIGSGGCAILAWVADWLTQIGDRKLDRARRDLARGRVFDQDRSS